MANYYSAAKINGTLYGGFTSSIFFTPFQIRAVSFGSLFNSGHFDIKDILVSDHAWGNGDLFAPVLDDLSEFDGVVGDDGSITASGGVLTVNDPSSGNDHYAWKLVGDIQTAYVSFQLRVYDDDPGREDFTDFYNGRNPDPPDLSSQIDGIFGAIGDDWGLEWSGEHFGTGPTGEPAYDQVDLYYSYAAPLPAAVAIRVAN